MNGAGKKIVEESALEDSRDPLTADKMGGQRSVQLRLPCRSLAELQRALKLAVNELTAIAYEVDCARSSDTTLLFGAQSRIHRLNKKINCYRSGGRDW